MKIPSLLSFAVATCFIVACEKAPTEAERNAQVEKEVQARLAAERLTDDQQRLAQQQADLDAREKALASKESARATATATPVARSTPRAVAASVSSSSRASEDDSSYDTFYRKLEPYGAWRESADYGFVWQPRAAQSSRNWRPYTDGRWAYTDAGWTWVSDEPFGWATYHYGRWTRLSGVGWVWVPGDEWAPAWVSWRTGDQNVGWAPLPPQARFDRNKGIHKWADNYYDIDAGEYVFVPNEEIGAENIERAVLPPERNVSIINQTTNVTNITYNQSTIVNEGPNYDELRARSHRPVERLRLQRDFEMRADEAPKARVSGDFLQMITPRFNARANNAPRTSAPRIERTAVERNIPGSNPAEAERAREKMRNEVPPPADAPEKKIDKPVVPSAPAATVAPAQSASATPVATATAAPTIVPTATPISTPRATPVTTPTATPVATPVATPRATPVATPRATPVESPVATPIATPVATHAPESDAATPAVELPRPRLGAPRPRDPNRAPVPTPPAPKPAATAASETAPEAPANSESNPRRDANPRGRNRAPVMRPTPPSSAPEAAPAEEAPKTPDQDASRAPRSNRRPPPRQPLPATAPSAPEEKPAATPEP